MKTTLAYLHNSALLYDIANEHPLLIYFICHLGNPNIFKTDLFDDELNCRALEKHDLTIYKSRKDRKGHHVTKLDCTLSKPVGEMVYNELKQKGICKELSNFFDLKDEENNHIYINKEDFVRLFWDNFQFEEHTDKIIENKVKELEERYNINLPHDGHNLPKDGNDYTIHYEFINNIFHFVVRIKCECSNDLEEFIEENNNNFESFESYIIKCNRCNKIFYIVYNFYYCSKIIR